jgi:hypothetical protein
MIFSAAIPHSMLLYPMIWNDACSDAFFMAFEISITWVACLNALEVRKLPFEIIYYRELLHVVWDISITKLKQEMTLS